ncbi:MAG: NUDIX hydrolase [Spirochaetaceae bacterium]|jgi:8-oxo-dGTP pyrophosphatase MutT (NUDIX family)|nr:NUDIX hydrolase [Spirochaetaceae bacterium]
MINENKLIWNELERKTVFTTKIFSVCEAVCMSPCGARAPFSVLESNNWAIVIPVINTKNGEEFVMVRQWRHGARAMSVEFPGGVIERHEAAAAGAQRELREETGYVPSRITLIGSMNPNPAFMENCVSFFVAEDLSFAGNQKLDEDEYVSVELHPVDEVIKNMGSPPYIHALMAAALNFWIKYRSDNVR